MTERLYNRFIPREELRSYVAWTPGTFPDPDQAPSQDPAPDSPAAAREPSTEELRAQHEAQMQALRETAHQEGYRQGLQDLEGFKQAHVAQVAGQMSVILEAFQAQLAALEQGLATELAGLAAEIARQVVQRELVTQPRLIEAVAQDALAALVHSARHVRVKLHPEDHEWLVAQGRLDLASRQACLVADPGLERGGCLVESDIAGIDASVPARWRRVLAALGQDREWRPDGAQAGGLA